MPSLIITYPNRKDENGNPIIKVVHVKSTVNHERMPIEIWDKFIRNKSFRKLFLNRFR